MKPPFEWDANSDQPYQLKDRQYKKKMRTGATGSLVKTILAALIWLPLAILLSPFLKHTRSRSADFTGLIVDPLREPEATLAMLEALDVSEILIRVKLWEPGELDPIVAFLKRLNGTHVFFVLMQDREHVEDSALQKQSFDKVFSTLSPFGKRFQIGTTINRAKWGFAAVDEYLRFFKTAQTLRNERYPALKLIGPGVIDFEYHFAAHTFFNLQGIRFDAVNALLYVDRRGAPEHKQMWWNLTGKIRFFSALVSLSPFARFPFYITETNWPLTGTAPFAPTSEKECVDEESYASFMVRYFLLARATRAVDTVYWHQLIAPGYGLVDRRQALRKRSAYDAFKTMNTMLKGSKDAVLKERGGLYELQLRKSEGVLRIFWSDGSERLRHFNGLRTFTDRDGNRFKTDRLIISSAPVYLLEKDPS